MPKIRGAAAQARRPRLTGQIDAISAASLNEQIDERLMSVLAERSQEGNAGVQTTALERLESWHTWLVSLFDNLLEVGGTPTWLLDSNMQQLRALTARLDQGEAKQLHFLIGQCPAGTRLLNTLNSLSGSGALLMTNADPQSTLAVDLFPYCIGQQGGLCQCPDDPPPAGSPDAQLLTAAAKAFSCMLLETGLINHISSTYIFGRVAALALAGTWVGMPHSEDSRWAEEQPLLGGFESLELQARLLPHPVAWLFYPRQSLNILRQQGLGEQEEMQAKVLKWAGMSGQFDRKPPPYAWSQLKGVLGCKEPDAAKPDSHSILDYIPVASEKDFKPPTLEQCERIGGYEAEVLSPLLDAEAQAEFWQEEQARRACQDCKKVGAKDYHRRGARLLCVTCYNRTKRNELIEAHKDRKCDFCPGFKAIHGLEGGFACESCYSKKIKAARQIANNEKGYKCALCPATKSVMWHNAKEGKGKWCSACYQRKNLESAAEKADTEKAGRKRQKRLLGEGGRLVATRAGDTSEAQPSRPLQPRAAREDAPEGTEDVAAALPALEEEEEEEAKGGVGPAADPATEAKKYEGVAINPVKNTSKPYVGYIHLTPKVKTTLGYYKTAKEAAQARDQVLLKRDGWALAQPNFKKEVYAERRAAIEASTVEKLVQDIQSEARGMKPRATRPASNFHGVHWAPGGGQEWKAEVRISAKATTVGVWHHTVHAAHAHDIIDLKKRGFARAQLNFPREVYDEAAIAADPEPTLVKRAAQQKKARKSAGVQGPGEILAGPQPIVGLERYFRSPEERAAQASGPSKRLTLYTFSTASRKQAAQYMQRCGLSFPVGATTEQMADIYREAMRKQAEEDEARRRGPGDGDRL